PNGCSDIVLQGGERILDDFDVITALGEFVVDTAPAGSIGKGAVNENNILDGCGRCDRGGEHCKSEGRSAGQCQGELCQFHGNVPSRDLSFRVRFRSLGPPTLPGNGAGNPLPGGGSLIEPAWEGTRGR